MTYLDNAATTNTKPPQVVDAVIHALTGGTGNSGRGANDAALSAARIVYNCRERIARFFGFPSPSCIAFTSNSTEALNTALLGTLRSGDHVVTTAAEHNSVLRPLFFLEDNGVHIDIVPLDANGAIRYDAMEQAVTDKTKAVVVTLASNVTGNLTDIARISGIIRQHTGSDGKRPLLIADASQTAGSFPINVADIDGHGGKIDILCFTGHKALMGPQGTGGICVMPDIEVKPLKRGGSGIHSFSRGQPTVMPTALEAGTLNAHGIAGLDAAIQFIEETGLETIRKHEQELTRLFYDGVKHIPDVRIYGAFSTDAEGILLPRAPIVSLNLGNTDSAEICDILSVDYGIATRAGAHCAPLVHRHFKTVDQGMVRFSFGWFTTETNVHTALEALYDIQKTII